MIDLASPLDLTNPEAPEFLANLQGNILKSHGRDHTAHLLLRFTAAPAVVRPWIALFARTSITSAADSRLASEGWKITGGRGARFTMFLLSAAGYRALDLTAAIPVPSGPFEPPFAGEYFTRGMKNQATLSDVNGRTYNDPPAAAWEPGYQGDIHAMILLADDDSSRLDASVKTHCESLRGIAEILAVERGDTIHDTFNGGEHVIEHFGFRDGISQPLVIKQEIDKEIAARGNAHWDPSAALSLLLTKEPGPDANYGSFMVFRKLEQNAAGYWNSLQQLADREHWDVEATGAMAVGRFRDGTPAVPTTPPPDPAAERNDFHYDSDPQGGKCPFHAHIRKTNPRGDITRLLGVPAEFERAKRIVRHGITYGPRPDLLQKPPGPRPSRGVGLLFMCFQASLDQFVIQQEGADSNDFVTEGTGPDAVYGQNPAPVDQTWPSTGTAKFNAGQFVKMLGGEYFFAPSLPFLTSL